MTLIATPGAANANSYGTLAEANEYHDTRMPLVPPWVASGQDAANERLLIHGTRTLDALANPRKVLKKGSDGVMYYVTARGWSGTIASSTQALAWPRDGMYDRHGRAIPNDTIPTELKEALFEFAGQLQKGDRTLDNDAANQGIKSISAGSVAITFKDDEIVAHVLPDAVIAMMPASWFTDEIVTMARPSTFEMA